MLSYENYKLWIAGLTEYADATMNGRFRTIAAVIAPGSRVLDVACGSGTLMQALEAKGCRTRGIDFAPGAVAHAKAKNLDVTLGDVDSFENDSRIQHLMLAEYDAVIFSKCLGYLNRKNELMKSLRAKLVIVNQRNPNYWRYALRRWRNAEPASVIENLPYVGANGRTYPQTSLRALRDWGESYGFKSKVLSGNFLRARDAVTIFCR